jgi:hypothetical protein
LILVIWFKSFAGSKAVHAREFGNGGLAYLVKLTLAAAGCGNVSLTGASDIISYLKAVGTERTAVSDSSRIISLKIFLRNFYCSRKPDTNLAVL